MSFTIPTNLYKPISTTKLGSQFATKSRTATIVCQQQTSSEQSPSTLTSQLKAFSAALALSSIVLSAPVLPASADISGLTPCKDSKQFAKHEKQFDNYGKQGLLCGSDGLPHLIVSGDQRHWGDEKKPAMKEIIIDVPLANKLIWRGFSWPVAAYREYLNGELTDPNF
ncbi:hypothetical protein RD792_003794 [Penstemon davidsonii]|uniref:Photosystem I reaction center subunit III n=1 Tax=Penstemon davidsonii TaxID=160366 RepID=A0ABR0DFP5_9LAMI|nr:hypothetical protein RD792_003794 [Penstemon davidsonii]